MSQHTTITADQDVTADTLPSNAARTERDYRAAPLRRRWLSKTRLWLVVSVIVLLSALTITALTPDKRSVRPLDPDSASQAGSRALAVLLRNRGTNVVRSTDISTIDENEAVVLINPELYSQDQLKEFANTHRLVLVDPPAEVLHAVDPVFPNSSTDTYGFPATLDPDCDVTAAQAAGQVDFDAGTVFQASNRPKDLPGYVSCYQSRILLSDKLLVFGSSSLLTNEWLAHKGVAALDINLLSNNGGRDHIYWLMGQGDVNAKHTESTWVLFPDWAPRAALWLVLLSFVAALWKAARLAQVVTEPLPVVVRSAEVVEGHGRLYRKAPGSLAHAATILREATARRLKLSMGIGRHAPTVTVAAIMNSPGTDVTLLGPAPTDKEGLVRLAQDLARLEEETIHPAPAGTEEQKIQEQKQGRTRTRDDISH